MPFPVVYTIPIMKYNPEIDLTDIAKAFDQTEPFTDFDGALHNQMLNAMRDRELKNIHFLCRGNLIAGRFYCLGRVRAFAYTSTKRIGDLARFMDCVFNNLRPYRQRKRDGTVCDADLNFSVAQMEEDTKYFFEHRRDVFELLTQITKRIRDAARNAPTGRAESNKTNMEKYIDQIKSTRTMMLEEFAESRKEINQHIDAHFNTLTKQNIVLRDLVADLTAEVRRVCALVNSSSPLEQPAVIDSKQTLLPTQEFIAGEFKPVNSASVINIYEPPTC